ncbi:type IV pilin protein [Psychromonas sp. KJ10-10]|uniref:type IV pilin protein n=1 Tax=Psychromonas sp. KJ10-10 TaxID=3391823 RepID=UPI0039B547B1
MKKHSGLTIIELLIVIAIIGILASIAYPSLQSYVLRTNRGDAQTELLKAQLKQTALHILNPLYSDDESALGLVNTVHYKFSVISASATTYSMKAVAIGQQINDVGCTILTINENSEQTPSNCWH